MPANRYTEAIRMEEIAMMYTDILFFISLFGGLILAVAAILAVILLLVWVYRILATLKDIRRLLAASQTDQLAEHRQE